MLGYSVFAKLLFYLYSLGFELKEVGEIGKVYEELRKWIEITIDG